jgi:hypothetical protein
MKPKIPCLYIIVANKIKEQSLDGKIKSKEVRTMLGKYFRFPKHKLLRILKELHDYKLIKCTNFTYIDVCYDDD